MDQAYAPPTPLTGPYPLRRMRAIHHWLGGGRKRARVYLLPHGLCRVARRGERLPLRAALTGDHQGVYFVDEDSHTVDFECELPSADPGLLFSVRIRLIWWVHDVERAVQARVGDVRHALRPFLESYLGRSSREYALNAIGPAEDRLRREMAGDLPLENGLTIRPLTVALRAEDAGTTEHDDRLSELHREMLVEEARGRLEIQRARNDVAAWQIRLDFYRSVIDAGMPAVLALRLMVDPSSAGDVAGEVDGAHPHDQIGSDGLDRPTSPALLRRVQSQTGWPRWSDPDTDPGVEPSVGELISLPEETGSPRPDPAVHPGAAS